MNLEIPITFACKGLPPRCRKPQNFRGRGVVHVNVPELAGEPKLAIEILEKKKVQTSLFWDGENLLKPVKGNLKEFTSDLFHRGQRGQSYDFIEENCTLTESSEDEVRKDLNKTVEEYRVSPNGTVYEIHPEPRYTTHYYMMGGDSISLTENPQGLRNTHRLDQFDELFKKTLAANKIARKRHSPETYIRCEHRLILPECLKSPLNPGEYMASATGEPLGSLREKIQAEIAFCDSYHEDGTKITFLPTPTRNGLWRPAVLSYSEKHLELVAQNANGEILRLARIENPDYHEGVKNSLRALLRITGKYLPWPTPLNELVAA